MSRDFRGRARQILIGIAYLAVLHWPGSLRASDPSLANHFNLRSAQSSGQVQLALDGLKHQLRIRPPQHREDFQRYLEFANLFRSPQIQEYVSTEMNCRAAEVLQEAAGWAFLPEFGPDRIAEALAEGQGIDSAAASLLFEAPTDQQIQTMTEITFELLSRAAHQAQSREHYREMIKTAVRAYGSTDLRNHALPLLLGTDQSPLYEARFGRPLPILIADLIGDLGLRATGRSDTGQTEILRRFISGFGPAILQLEEDRSRSASRTFLLAARHTITVLESLSELAKEERLLAREVLLIFIGQHRDFRSRCWRLITWFRWIMDSPRPTAPD